MRWREHFRRFRRSAGVSAEPLRPKTLANAIVATEAYRPDRCPIAYVIPVVPSSLGMTIERKPLADTGSIRSCRFNRWTRHSWLLVRIDLHQAGMIQLAETELDHLFEQLAAQLQRRQIDAQLLGQLVGLAHVLELRLGLRSEERRVGKECRL